MGVVGIFDRPLHGAKGAKVYYVGRTFYRGLYVAGMPEIPGDQVYVTGDSLQIRWISGREIIQDADFLTALDQFRRNMGPDEPATARDECDGGRANGLGFRNNRSPK